MPGVFISYRRQDAAGHAGRMFDHLARRFGAGSVFMDVAGIQPGMDFVDEIDRAVGSCDALIVVIGREWLACTDGSNRRRLDDAADFVRLEVGAALKRKVQVIPVLVEGATMPRADALPADLQPLARRNAIELRDTRWDSDLGILIGALEKLVTVKPPPRPHRWPRLVAAMALVAIVAAVGWYMLRPPVDPPDLKIPKVAGMPRSEAERALTSVGFSPGPVRSEAAGRAKPGTVVRTVPAEGTRANRGAEVSLVLAQEPPPGVSIPDVTGMLRDDAERALTSVGYTVGPVRLEAASGAKTGTVVRTVPGAGAPAARGTLVSLVMAQSVNLPVPGVAGMSRADAERALTGAGFTIGPPRSEAGSGAGPGTVLRTVPPEGTPAAPRSQVSLVVAEGRLPGGIAARGVLKVDRSLPVDLDSGPGDQTRRGEAVDLMFQSRSPVAGTLLAVNDAGLAVMDEKPDYNRCTMTRMAPTRVPYDVGRAEMWICVRTNGRQYSVIGLNKGTTGARLSSGSMVIDYITYTPKR